MADYAPNYTPRYRLRYSALGQVHTAQVRFHRTEAAVAAQGAALFTDLLAALEPNLVADFTILGADVAGTDSDIFLPTSTLPTGSGNEAIALDSSYKPLFLSFVGRSTGGSRAVLTLYGYNNSPTAADNTANDWRVSSAESSAVLAAVAALNGATDAPAHAIDGNPVVWYPYANVGFNAYYQRKARRS